MLKITATPDWHATHPGAAIGLLALTGLDNTGPAPELEARKPVLEAALRAQHTGRDRAGLLALPVLAAYDRYYGRFDKTYHVQLQLESILFKGKRLPTVAPAVDANFMAELDTLLLTAGHDIDRLTGPVIIDIARAGDTLTQLNGAAKALRAGDMVMRDAAGVACSILYGQDARSPITPQTTRVLYVTYAPPGLTPADLTAQLDALERNVRLFAPQAEVGLRQVLWAGQEAVE